MRTLTKKEILSSFSKESRKKIFLPNLDSIDWENLDYLGWIHPSEHLGYIVYELFGKLQGLILERNPKPPPTGKIKMCSWCYTLNFSSNIRLFTYQIPNKKISIGNYICANLDCSLYIRGIKKTYVTQMPETLTLSEKIERLHRNLKNFFELINEKKS
jgi:hypothetical protein